MKPGETPKCFNCASWKADGYCQRTGKRVWMCDKCGDHKPAYDD